MISETFHHCSNAFLEVSKTFNLRATCFSVFEETFHYHPNEILVASFKVLSYFQNLPLFTSIFLISALKPIFLISSWR